MTGIECGCGRGARSRASINHFYILFLVVLLSSAGLAQQDSVSPPPQQPGIQDNSFLVEEAYNQEFGVVQHISSFTRFWNSKDWVYSFTQEWPVPGDARHQLSYTLLLQHTGALSGSGAGIGDVALNYRYQLVGNSHTRLAFAPRLSVLLPTGDTREGRGSGGVGWQTQLPVSFLVTPKLATHWNAGATVIPTAKNDVQQQARSVGYNLGQS